MKFIDTFLDKIRHASTRIMAFSNWYTLVWPFTRILKKERIIKVRGGAKMFVRNVFGSDFVVTYEMFFRDDYGLKRFPLNDGPMSILDLGANIGAFTVLAATRYKNAKIYSFEPEDTNYNQLKFNASLNNIDNRVTAIKEAVADTAGEKVFHMSSYDYAHSLLEEQIIDNPGTKIKVTCTTLEQTVQKYNLKSIDILKLDIEGAEYDMFLKMPKNILDMVQVILMEIHTISTHKPEDLENYLKMSGFKMLPSKTHPRVFMFVRNLETVVK